LQTQNYIIFADYSMMAELCGWGETWYTIPPVFIVWSQFVLTQKPLTISIWANG